MRVPLGKIGRLWPTVNWTVHQFCGVGAEWWSTSQAQRAGYSTLCTFLFGGSIVSLYILVCIEVQYIIILYQVKRVVCEGIIPGSNDRRQDRERDPLAYNLSLPLFPRPV